MVRLNTNIVCDCQSAAHCSSSPSLIACVLFPPVLSIWHLGAPCIHQEALDQCWEKRRKKSCFYLVRHDEPSREVSFFLDPIKVEGEEHCEGASNTNRRETGRREPKDMFNKGEKMALKDCGPSLHTRVPYILSTCAPLFVCEEGVLLV